MANYTTVTELPGSMVTRENFKSALNIFPLRSITSYGSMPIQIESYPCAKVIYIVARKECN